MNASLMPRNTTLRLSVSSTDMTFSPSRRNGTRIVAAQMPSSMLVSTWRPLPVDVRVRSAPTMPMSPRQALA